MLTNITQECIPGSNNYLYWDGNIGSINLKNGSQAYLGAYNCSNPGTPVFFSHYINLIEMPSKPSSTSDLTTLTSSFSTSFATLFITSSLVTSPTTSPSSSPVPSISSPTDGSSNAAAIGGGIGGGLGGALVLIAAALAFWRYRGRKDKEQKHEHAQLNWTTNHNHDAVFQNHKTNSDESSYQPATTYPPPQSISELPSTPRYGNNPARQLFEI